MQASANIDADMQDLASANRCASALQPSCCWPAASVADVVMHLLHFFQAFYKPRLLSAANVGHRLGNATELLGPMRIHQTNARHRSSVMMKQFPTKSITMHSHRWLEHPPAQYVCLCCHAGLGQCQQLRPCNANEPLLASRRLQQTRQRICHIPSGSFLSPEMQIRAAMWCPGRTASAASTATRSAPASRSC